MAAHEVLLTLPLSEADRRSLIDEFPDVKFVDGESDADLDSIDVLFAGEPVGDELIDRMGKLAVEMIVKYSNGETIEPEILIPTELYRQADGLKDPSLKD